MKIVGMVLLRWKRFVLDIGGSLEKSDQFLGVVGHPHRASGNLPAARDLCGLGV
jgi:hypothetical protein